MSTLFNTCGVIAIASKDDKDIVDFRLVSTYLPVLLILMRTTMLWLFIELAGSLYETCNVIVIIISFVWLDYVASKPDRFSQICCFCVMPAGAFLLSTCVAQESSASIFVFSYSSACSDMFMTVLHWSIGIAWAVASAVLLAHSVLALKIPYKTIYVVVGIMAMCAHELCSCAKNSRIEIMFRSCIFYVFCLLFYYGSDSHGDLESLAFLTPHLGLHFLFVEKIVCFASIIAFSCLLAKLYLQKQKTPRHVAFAASKQAPAVHKAAADVEAVEDKDELLKQLRVAQGKI